MKLSKKLIPFTSIAALGATIAPLALTSCGTKTNTGVLDLTKWYTPTIAKHPFAILDDAGANAAYFGTSENWLNEDTVAERLTEDYKFGSARKVQSMNQNDGYIVRPSDILGPISTMEAATVAEQLINEFTGLDNVIDFVDGYTFNNTKYTQFDCSISDVRVAHMTNYFPLLIEESPIEYPTISFEIEYEYEMENTYRGKNGFIGGVDGATIKYYDPNQRVIDTRVLESGTTIQHHKGTLTFTNVPVKVQYNYSSAAYSYAWNLMVDLDTLVQTESSTRVPYSIHKIDKATTTTQYTMDQRVNQNNATRVTDVEYYSGMLYDKEVDDTEGSSEHEQLDNFQKETYDWAKENKKTWTDAQCQTFSLRMRASKKIEMAVHKTISNVAAEWFNCMSYYLFSVAHK